MFNIAINHTKETSGSIKNSFDKTKRLLKSREFSLTLRKGQRVRQSLFVLVSNHNAVKAKLGITISKKVSKRAVDRNRIKRLVRESFRKNYSRLPCRDFVIIAQPGCVNHESRQIYAAIENIFKKQISRQRYNHAT